MNKNEFDEEWEPIDKFIEEELNPYAWHRSKYAIWAMTIFIAMVALWHANKAEAEELSVHLSGYSYHVATGHKYDYNSNHQLTAIEYGSFMVGRFKNSYSRETRIIAYGWSKQWGNWRGSVHVGLTHGYRSCYGDEGDTARVCPVAFPALYYTKYRVQPGVIMFGEALALTVRVEV